jgi:Tol biopolymer transport system component
MLVDGVEQLWSNGRSPWNVSENGTLIYLPGGLWTTEREIVRVSREGEVEPLEIEPGAYLNVAMSPDGRRLAVTEFSNGDTNVVIRDLERGIDTPLPLDAVNAYPVWNPDGSEIVFDTALKGPWDIYRFAVEGGSEPEALIEGTPDQIPLAWSPDGRFLVWEDDYAEVRMMDLRGDREPRSLLPNDSEGVAISPDSRWIAFSSRISGRKEVVVRAFPEGTREFRVSIDGGAYPLWSREGRELFFRRGDAVLAASIRVEGDGIVAGRPRELFRGELIHAGDRHQWSYDPTTDELIMIRNGKDEISRHRLLVVLDWPAGANTLH